ncbi:LysR family transcriptional regulator, partial [Clostridium saudiense]|nr:LysR family transcriptional regulator [Clostridium saudiense]
NNAIAIVESEIGYAICLESLVNDRRGICFKEFYPRLETGSVLVWKKNQVFSTATRKFIDEIKRNNDDN